MAVQQKKFYIVRVKGEKGIKGEQSLSTISEPVYKNLLKSKQNRDNLVAEKGKNHHYPVTLDDVKIYRTLAEVPQTVKDIPHNHTDGEASEKEQKLTSENERLKAELAAFKAMQANTETPKAGGKKKTKKEEEAELAAAAKLAEEDLVDGNSPVFDELDINPGASGIDETN